MTIRITSRFKKAFKKLPQYVKERAQEKEKLFRINPFEPRLDAHKLHGKYQNYWAFTVIGNYRIMFAFSARGMVDFVNVGTHEIYK